MVRLEAINKYRSGLCNGDKFHADDQLVPGVQNGFKRG